MLFFQMAFPHPAIFANSLLFIFTSGKVRKEHITNTSISAAVLLKKGFLCFHGLYLQNHIWKYRKREFRLFVSLTK